MNSSWVIQLKPEDGFTLAPLRLVPAIEIGVAPEVLWVRGKAADETLSRLLQSLPALARFDGLPDGRLRAVGSRIPVLSLPNLTWVPLLQWFRVELPSANSPTAQPARAGLSLARSTQEKPANVLLTDFDSWQSFALHAPEVRLRPLRFAMSAGREIAIWGTPLPPISGRRFVEQEGIAIPAGFSWRPGVSAKVLRQVLQAGENSLVIWDGDSCLHLHPEQLIPASRGGVRATAEAIS